MITIRETCEFLRNCGDVTILTHCEPDGDCIGAGFALMHILSALGKRSRVICSDEFPKRYDFITKTAHEFPDFKEDDVIAVDLADPRLLGNLEDSYADRVKLCIDHHVSNVNYAEKTLLNPQAAAACEIIYDIAEELGINIDAHCAACIYTGISTDTGCFKYENTTARTHQIVSELMTVHKLKYAKINRKMFDVKSPARIRMEKIVTELMEYYLNNRMSIIFITKDIMSKSGIDENDSEGISALTLQVEGVEVGVTVREKSAGEYKISMRSADDANVMTICCRLGGGGHTKAAGCTLFGSLDDVKRILIESVRKEIGD